METITMNGLVVESKLSAMDKCGGCLSNRGHRVLGFTRVYVCDDCNGTVGTCYVGESHELVKPWFAKTEVPAGLTAYFDFITIGVKVARRHGFYDPRNRTMTQVG